ncbi:hypothetical protein [Asanoa iriomotensis]|uniref:Uncharacterized protein n=1 Tax=Asanoa iriomotensis TaxID=234613 RepID=A0ABQ4CBR6_9ACTN|nr:hypothetical protein [Asanoa iriomotensis]GIF60222.1 hypothetical protein Air01nite_63170 [Asanoa iriomotensis]
MITLYHSGGLEYLDVHAVSLLTGVTAESLRNRRARRSEQVVGMVSEEIFGRVVYRLSRVARHLGITEEELRERIRTGATT